MQVAANCPEFHHVLRLLSPLSNWHWLLLSAFGMLFQQLIERLRRFGKEVPLSMIAFHYSSEFIRRDFKKPRLNKIMRHRGSLINLRNVHCSDDVPVLY